MRIGLCVLSLRGGILCQFLCLLSILGQQIKQEVDRIRVIRILLDIRHQLLSTPSFNWTTFLSRLTIASCLCLGNFWFKYSCTSSRVFFPFFCAFLNLLPLRLGLLSSLIRLVLDFIGTGRFFVLLLAS